MDVKAILRAYLDQEGALPLAKRLGVTRQHIWAILIGKTKPGRKVVQALNLQEQTKITRTRPTPQPRMTAAKRREYIRKAWQAQQIVRRAVKAGTLPNLRKDKVLCVDCLTRKATNYDHRDYAKPLDVSPVCGLCNHKRGPAKIQ
jgi:hypothetical protein